MAAANVLFALSIFRHGDRTFILKEGWADDNDPVLTDFIRQNEGYGQLTSLGRDMHRRVGTHMRERYDHLIRGKDHRNTLHVRSTQFDRTIRSVEAQLSTMFPDEALDIPIHTASRNEEWLLRGFSGSSCPALKWDDARNICIYNGTEVDVISADDSLTVCGVHKCLDRLVWPEAERKWILEKRKKVLLDYVTFSRAKLGAAPLASQITRILTNVSNGDILWSNDPTFFDVTWPLPEPRLEDPKLILYSAHDTTLEFILGALGVFNGTIPNYASQIVFEIYRETTKDTCLRIWYNKDPNDPWKVEIPLCKLKCCTVTDLKDRLHESIMTVEEYTAACRVNDNPDEIIV